MLNSCSDKRGVTLIEVLAVVSIMGILAGIGVSSFRSAIANSRIKDAGINVTAFMERAANEAIRLNTNLCLVANGKTIKLHKSACNDEVAGDQIAEMTLESANVFVNGDCPSGDGTRYSDNKVTLTPKIGVSAIPAGCFVVRYGASDRRAAIVKVVNKFSVFYKLSYDDGSNWFVP